MKKVLIVILVTLVIMGIICGVGYRYQDEIYVYYQYEVLKVRDNIKIDKNEYYKDVNYHYVQNTDDFIAKDSTHLKNIFFTIINSGVDEFTFYCGDNYSKCLDDVNSIINNQDLLSGINNFVHPYNSFAKIHTSYDEFGKVIVEIEKIYSDEDIKVLDEKVDSIINSSVKSNMSNEAKIEAVHNYIINNGKYASDELREKNKDKAFNKANDILIDGNGLCSSYADAMALFLDKFDIENYKIASDTHIWNLVKIKDEWLHLDLTWDDPITNTGEDILEKYFLLIDNDRLKELKVEKHEYNSEIYKEALN